MDHFRLLGVAPSPDPDLEELERRYLEKSRAAHPDRPGNAVEQGLVDQAALNEAWRVLQDPWARFSYLIEKLEPGCLAAHKTLSPAFLATAMEAHEEVLAAQDDDARRAELVSKTRQELENSKQHIIALLRASPADVDEAAREVHRARYAQRRLEALSGQRREL